MYCIFWPLIHKFVNFYEKQYLWANCPLGELSASELSVGELSAGELSVGESFGQGNRYPLGLG